MTPDDLRPEVQKRAAAAARAAWLNAGVPVAETWPTVVDAVAGVLAAAANDLQAAPELAAERDQLRARVAEAEAVRDRALMEHAKMYARVAELEGALEDLEREQARSDKHLRIADKAVARFPPLVAERDQLKARVAQLEAALTDALDGMEEMLPYVTKYFVEKHELNGYIPRARTALAAGAEKPDA